MFNNFEEISLNPLYMKYFETFEDFKTTFLTEKVELDIEVLPECIKLDSLERWLKIYENAINNFEGELEENDKNYRIDLIEIANIYGEKVIYPNKRKIEFIKKLIIEEMNYLPHQLNEKLNCHIKEDLRTRVENYFYFMNYSDPRKHKQILGEMDFNKLIDWITFYFENKFSLPMINEPIQKVNTAKGNIIYAFMHFFKQEHPALTKPDSLFEFVKASFYEYRDDKIENMKKQKEPQYFKNVMNNNN